MQSTLELLSVIRTTELATGCYKFHLKLGYYLTSGVGTSVTASRVLCWIRRVCP